MCCPIKWGKLHDKFAPINCKLRISGAAQSKIQFIINDYEITEQQNRELGHPGHANDFLVVPGLTLLKDNGPTSAVKTSTQ